MMSQDKQETQGSNEFGAALAGKYLTFQLADETYGIEITKIQEIIQMQQVTKVPKVETFIRGVINLRGKVIPVIDLRRKFSLPEQDDTDKTCIIVVQVELSSGETVTIGTIIDEVKEVLDIPAEDIEPAPAFGAEIDTSFILGMGKVGKDVKILLDIEQVLTRNELSSMSDFGGESN